jgi:hypothetical protein
MNSSMRHFSIDGGLIRKSAPRPADEGHPLDTTPTGGCQHPADAARPPDDEMRRMLANCSSVCAHRKFSRLHLGEAVGVWCDLVNAAEDGGALRAGPSLWAPFGLPG